MTTQMVDKSNFDNKQYKADLQSAYECGFVFGANDVLEKIKAEFDNDLNLYKNEYDGTYNCSLDYIKGIITCKTIIDNHIEELKGENKSEQADTEFNHESFYEFLLNVINPNEMEKYRSMFLSSGEIVN